MNCIKCKGTGWIHAPEPIDDHMCERCNGSGEEPWPVWQERVRMTLIIWVNRYWFIPLYKLQDWIRG